MFGNARTSPLTSNAIRSSRPSPSRSAKTVRPGSNQPLATTRGVPQLKFIPLMFGNARTSPLTSNAIRSSRPSPSRSAKTVRPGSNQPLATTRGVPQLKFIPSMFGNARTSPLRSNAIRSSRPSPSRSAKTVRPGSNQPLATTRGVPQLKFIPSMFGNARTSPLRSNAIRSSRPSPSRSAKTVRSGSVQPLATTRGSPQLKFIPSMFGKARTSPLTSNAIRSSRPSPSRSAKTVRPGSNQPLATTRGVPKLKFIPSMFGNARTSPLRSNAIRSSRPSPSRSAKTVRSGSVQPLATTRGSPQLKFIPSMFGKARTSPLTSNAIRSSRPSPLRSANTVRPGSVQPLATTRGVPQLKFIPSMFGNARTSPLTSNAIRSSRPSPSRSANTVRPGSNQPLATTRGVPQLKFIPSMFGNARTSPL